MHQEDQTNHVIKNKIKTMTLFHTRYIIIIFEIRYDNRFKAHVLY